MSSGSYPNVQGHASFLPTSRSSGPVNQPAELLGQRASKYRRPFGEALLHQSLYLGSALLYLAEGLPVPSLLIISTLCANDSAAPKPASVDAEDSFRPVPIIRRSCSSTSARNPQIAGVHFCRRTEPVAEILVGPLTANVAVYFDGHSETDRSDHHKGKLFAQYTGLWTSPQSDWTLNSLPMTAFYSG